MVKSEFHGQSSRFIGDLRRRKASYIDLNYFLPDPPCLDVIITTRSSRAQEMSTLEVMEAVEAAVFVV